MSENLDALKAEMAACRACETLPLGPRPVFRLSTTARLLIVGQAPGTKVHASGLPFDDPSGDLLRRWLGLEREAFYDAARIAFFPMALCYPGRGPGGDLPPPPLCAQLWRARVAALLPAVRLTLLVGAYAQAHYLGAARGPSLAATVRRWRDWRVQGLIPIPHPSPRNRRWLRVNDWFEAEAVPAIRAEIQAVLAA